MSKSDKLTREAKKLSREENIPLSVAKRKIQSHLQSPQNKNPYALTWTPGTNKETGEPVWMKMETNPHLLITGASGTGKTTLLREMINQLTTSSPSIKFWMIDTEKDLYELKDHPHTEHYVDDLTGFSWTSDEDFLQPMTDLLDLATEEISQRQAKRKDYPIMIIIDGTTILPESAKEKLPVILRNGRSVGVYMAITAQQKGIPENIDGLLKEIHMSNNGGIIEGYVKGVYKDTQFTPKYGKR